MIEIEDYRAGQTIDLMGDDPADHIVIPYHELDHVIAVLQQIRQDRATETEFEN